MSTKLDEKESLKSVLKGFTSGEKDGFIGGNAIRKPDYIPEVEVLSKDKAEIKSIIKELLLKWIVPNELSSRSNQRLDKKSLATKLNKSTFDTLLKHLPDYFCEFNKEDLQKYLTGESELLDEDMAYIQDMYKEISI